LAGPGGQCQLLFVSGKRGPISASRARATHTHTHSSARPLIKISPARCWSWTARTESSQFRQREASGELPKIIQKLTSVSSSGRIPANSEPTLRPQWPPPRPWGQYSAPREVRFCHLQVWVVQEASRKPPRSAQEVPATKWPHKARGSWWLSHSCRSRRQRAPLGSLTLAGDLGSH